MAEQVKFSKEELNKIQDLQKSYNELVYKFGQVNLSLEGVKRQKTLILSKLEEARSDEVKLIN